MGTDDYYKIILVTDLKNYSQYEYYELRTSLDGREVILEFPDPTGISEIQTLAQVHAYMYGNNSNWVDYTEEPD
jgi:hypothetical protein